MDIALVTCAALPGLWADDRILMRALRAGGLDARPVVWEDPYQDWREPHLCVIRSAWDYAFRRETFLAWAHSVASQTSLWNSSRIVEWNTHKRYLCDLADRGVPVVPTHVLAHGARIDLRACMERVRWNDVVLKAAVAQSGRYAMRVRESNLTEAQAHLNRLLPHEDMLLQPYLPAVEEHGELSVVFVEGNLTHAVRKRPAAGDFRVHTDHGGSVIPVIPTAAEEQAAKAALEAVDEPTLYARIDLVASARGPVVMELEIVEPELFFAHSPACVDRMVAAIRRRLGR